MDALDAAAVVLLVVVENVKLVVQALAQQIALQTAQMVVIIHVAPHAVVLAIKHVKVARVIAHLVVIQIAMVIVILHVLQLVLEPVMLHAKTHVLETVLDVPERVMVLVVHHVQEPV